jgi:nitroreductase
MEGMNMIQREQLLRQLNWRYATKQFDPARKISPEDWAALEESLVLTPSSFGLQPWKFIVVNDPAVREQLVPVSWGQRQVADASHYVVIAAKHDLGEGDIDAYLDRIAEVRGLPRESLASYRGMMVGSLMQGMDAAARDNWATRQAYIALGNLLNCAALLGIDACPMEGFEHAKYDEILGLKEKGLGAAVACALGYRARTDTSAGAKKVRFARENVLVEV